PEPPAAAGSASNSEATRTRRGFPVVQHVVDVDDGVDDGGGDADGLADVAPRDQAVRSVLGEVAAVDVVRPTRHGKATATTVMELHDSYQDASMALRLDTHLGTPDDGRPAVSSIGGLRIHQLLAAAGHRPRTRLVESLTANLRQQAEWPALRQTVVAWCES